MEQVLESLSHFLPEVALTVGMLLVILVDASGISARNALTRGLTVLTFLAGLYLCFREPGYAGTLFGGMAAVDPMSTFFKVLLLLAGLLVVLTLGFGTSRELWGLGQGEFYTLLLALSLSNLLLVSADNIAMVYLALEMVSVTSYVMVAYMKGDRLSNEASLKYVLFGAVSTGAMVYGLSLLYGLTGTTSLPAIRDFLALGLSDANRFSLYIIALFVFAGFGFKTAAAPFHFWCPDVYQGAPTPVTAYLSVAPKAAGFAVMTRFFFSGLSVPEASAWDLVGVIEWGPVLMLLSVLTMTVGNVAALTQTNMKRLLAYSSIAHAGYIMMGVVALSENGLRGMMLYLLVYLVMNLGAFLVVTLIHREDGSFDLRDYPGLMRRSPLLTVSMAVFMLSLIGIPPFVGFLGKLYVFGAIVEKGPSFYWYAVVGAVNAAIAAFYYARVMRAMIIDPGGDERGPLELPLADRIAVVGFALANFLPLLWWGRIDEWARGSLVLYAGL